MARSLLFNLLFYVTTTMFVVIGSPLLFAPRRWAMAALAIHGRFELWLLQTIAGITFHGRARQGAGAAETHAARGEEAGGRRTRDHHLPGRDETGAGRTARLQDGSS